MKTIKVLLCLLVLTALSCEKEDNGVDVNTVEFELDSTFKSLTNSKIGFEKDGEIVLGVSNGLIMKEFKKLVTKSGLELKLQSFEVVSIDNNKYLRFYSEGDNVSTIALIKDDNGNYRTGSTVCKSKACASGGGCVPNGLYCTECKWPNGNPGDCERITTGGGNQ